MAAASAAFALSGLLTLVLAYAPDEGRLALGAVAAVSGAISLALAALARRTDQRPPPSDEGPFERWTLE